MTKTLILLRHGKAESPLAVLDHDRPLAERGVREAGLAGELLAQYDIDGVLCSTSRRTRETLAATGIDATGITASATYSRKLYLAAPEEILAEVSETSEDVRTLLVVAHFPGLPETAAQLNPSGPHTGAILDRFPTSAFAVISLAGDWSDLAPGSTTVAGTVTDFLIPR